MKAVVSVPVSKFVQHIRPVRLIRWTRKLAKPAEQAKNSVRVAFGQPEQHWQRVAEIVKNPSFTAAGQRSTSRHTIRFSGTYARPFLDSLVLLMERG